MSTPETLERREENTMLPQDHYRINVATPDGKRWDGSPAYRHHFAVETESEGKATQLVAEFRQFYLDAKVTVTHCNPLDQSWGRGGAMILYCGYCKHYTGETCNYHQIPTTFFCTCDYSERKTP